MPGHAARHQIIAGVLVPCGVRAGTNAGRRRQWPSPHYFHPKSDGPHLGFREKMATLLKLTGHKASFFYSGFFR
ncbi:hypothetical protein, partial [Rhizobium sp. UGM030330-04]|uniref:hypothetical protein n=1 Tax=Rhizobium sp. UGM030330-04 TaxID=1378077 RepID=UPI001AEC992A